MKIKVLQTIGDDKFVEVDWEKAEPTNREIEVKSIMTGICRSDIDMMQGNFGPLPLEMQGHEGLGIVTKIGTNITDVKIGDYVATRGEPAYADFYNVRQNEYVVVPEAHPRYIIEPVACGINLIHSYLREIHSRLVAGQKMLILGSGFLSYVAYRYLTFEVRRFAKSNDFLKNIDVVGSHNKNLWSEQSVELKSSPDKNYDIVLDLKGQDDLFLNQDLINNNGLYIEAVSRSISKKESEVLLWKSITTVRPSPRNTEFYDCMKLGVELIENKVLNIDGFWTRSYNRKTEWKQAFEDGRLRPKNYSRGFIKWQ
jgi:D-arabinose 1-dehydrogenase-like Zn-dependent alcohol dehydrogenase